MSADDLIALAKAGGVALAVAMGFVILVFWRAFASGLVEWGSAVQRERKLLTDYGIQMRDERDAYRQQAEDRQSVVEQALELGALLKEFAPANRSRRAR